MTKYKVTYKRDNKTITKSIYSFNHKNFLNRLDKLISKDDELIQITFINKRGYWQLMNQ